MRTALTTCRPTHVEVPKDIWPKVALQSIRGPEPYLDTLPSSSPQVVHQAIELFTSAERPVIYIGRGARNAIHEVMELAERTQTPVVRTLGAAGFTPGWHAQTVGGLGPGGSEAASTLMNEADCILRIGATWWPQQQTPKYPALISIDKVPANVSVGVAPVYGVVCDAGVALKEFLARVGSVERPEWRKRVAEVKAEWDARIDHEAQAEGEPVQPARIIRSIENVVPHNAIITLDVGEHTLWFNRVFRGRGQDVVFSGKWRTMGFGLPAAAAAKVAYPDRPVVALVGDGGFSMASADFVSLAHHKLPVVVVVVNNGSLALEKHRMETMGMSPTGTLLCNPDFAELARAGGGVGYRVTKASELEAVLSDCILLDTPAVVEVLTADTAIPTVSAQG